MRLKCRNTKTKHSTPNTSVCKFLLVKTQQQSLRMGNAWQRAVHYLRMSQKYRKSYCFHFTSVFLSSSALNEEMNEKEVQHLKTFLKIALFISTVKKIWQYPTVSVLATVHTHLTKCLECSYSICHMYITQSGTRHHYDSNWS